MICRRLQLRVAQAPRTLQLCQSYKPAQLVRTFASFQQPSPSPPRLPKEEQEEFERLQKEAHNSLNKDPQDSSAMHPQFRKPYADFEGDRNPETGEIGGPKQDPLRHGDYSFNGRVTDF